MGALLEPVGPLSAGTYWRRRLIVIAVLVLALWFISRLGAQDGSASAADDGEVSATESARGTLAPTPSPTEAGPAAANPGAATDGSSAPSSTAAPPDPTAAGKSSGAAANPGASPGATDRPRPCGEGELSLAIDSSAARYAPDTRPKLALAVKTTGAAPCTRDLGPSGLGVVITSGQDRIWASQDCSTQAADVRVLTPGTPVTLEMTWDRLRSEPGCASVGAPARPGTYVATPVAGKRTGEQASFLLD